MTFKESWMNTNPFRKIKTENDAIELAGEICYCNHDLPKHIHETSTELMACLILYLWHEAPPQDEWTLFLIVELLKSAISDNTGQRSDLDRLILDMLKDKKSDHTCVKMYEQAKCTTDSYFRSAIEFSLKRLAFFNILNVSNHIEMLGGIDNGGALAFGTLLSTHLGDNSLYEIHFFDARVGLRNADWQIIQSAEANLFAALLTYSYHNRLNMVLPKPTDSLKPTDKIQNLLNNHFCEKISLLETRNSGHPAIEHYKAYKKAAGKHADLVIRSCRAKLTFWNEFN
jgi:hypothetical protein